MSDWSCDDRRADRSGMSVEVMLAREPRHRWSEAAKARILEGARHCLARGARGGGGAPAPGGIQPDLHLAEPDDEAVCGGFGTLLCAGGAGGARGGSYGRNASSTWPPR